MTPWNKLQSLARLVRDDPWPWRKVRERLAHNLLMLRLSRTREGWVSYRTAQGFRFLVDRQEPQTFWMHAQGHPDVGELLVLKRWVQPGDCCFDIGANIGYMTALLADAVGPQGKVWACEPGPETFRTLQRNIARLNLCHTHVLQSCVGRHSGRAAFFVAINPSHSPLQSLHPAGTTNGSFIETSVNMTSLDEMVATAGAACEPSLVKVDVEGAEAEVIAGGQRLIAGPNPPLFDLEVNCAALSRSGACIAAIAQILRPRHELLFINLSAPKHTWPINRLIPLPSTREGDLPPVGSLIAVPRDGAFADRRARLSDLLVSMT